MTDDSQAGALFVGDEAEVGDEADVLPKVPKYLEIADGFRSMIADGRLGPGAKLPSERTVANENRYGIETVRRAYKLLIQDGLIEQIHGKGTFVRNWKPVLRNIGKRMSADVWGNGQSVWATETDGREYGTDATLIHRGDAPAHVAEVMGETTVWVRERRHLVDERPVMLSRSYYPASIVDGSPITRPDTGPGGSPARLAELGHAPADHTEWFRSRMPTADERERLSLRFGSAVADIIRTSRDTEGRVVEVTEMVASGDAYVFQFDFTS